MKQMPAKIKNMLRRYASIQTKAIALALELGQEFERYGVPEDNLTAVAAPYPKEPRTEALADFHNAQCSNVEFLIGEIEKVFLYFANKEDGEEE